MQDLRHLIDNGGGGNSLASEKDPLAKQEKTKATQAATQTTSDQTTTSQTAKTSQTTKTSQASQATIDHRKGALARGEGTRGAKAKAPKPGLLATQGRAKQGAQGSIKAHLATKPALLYFTLVALYALALLLYARYSLNLDDVWMWEMIKGRADIFHGLSKQAGRFFPLAGIDLSLLDKLSANPYLYYTFNTSLFIITAVALFCALRELGASRYAPFLMVAFLNPSYMLIISSLCYPERLLCTSLALFLFALLHFMKGGGAASFITALIFANIALYLKETVFILIGGIGAGMVLAYLTGTMRTPHRRACALLGGALLGSALIFLASYLIYRGGSTIGHVIWLKHLGGEYARLVLNSPVISLGILLIVVVCISSCIRERRLPRALEYMLGSILVFVLSYAPITEAQEYYYAPAYIMGVPLLIYYCAGLLGLLGGQADKAGQAGHADKVDKEIGGLEATSLRPRGFVALATMVGLLYLVQTLPGFVTTYGMCKLYPYAYYEMIDFMKERHLDGRSFAYYGLLDKLDDGYSVQFAKMALEFSLGKNLGNDISLLSRQEVASGALPDYLLLSYKTEKFITSADFKEIEKHYTLVYKSPLSGLPYLGLNVLLRYAGYLARYKTPANFSARQYEKNANGQLFNTPLHIYVFRRK